VLRAPPPLEISVLDSRFKIQDSRFKIKDSRFKVQDSRFLHPEKCKIPVVFLKKKTKQCRKKLVKTFKIELEYLKV